MFSRRLAWDAPRNRLAQLLEEKRRRGVPLIDLTESNPTRAGLPYPVAALAAALSDPRAAAYEPAARGSAAARAAVATHYARRGLAVAPERIVLTASTSEAYALLFKLLADPGDAILTPRPSYPLFEYLAALEAVRVVTYPLALEERRFGIDLLAIERGAAEAAGARALVLVNPNNPTGTALRAAERRAIETIACRHEAAVIADEVFFDYLFEPRPDLVSMLSAREEGGPSCLVFTLGGMSKACGLPQMKLAWIVVDGPAGLAGAAVERLELVADTYLSVGGPVQVAAGPLLELGEAIRLAIRARLFENRAAAAELLRGHPSCRLLDADGGWYAILRLPAILPEEELVLRLLKDDDVLVHPGYFFDLPGECYLVLSLLPPPARFADGLGRILARAGRG
ncbi:MAG TPA: pyridoxal phosphate-dependent aminotransferase [Candidatus Polarisedimenticolia bacterium]